MTKIDPRRNERRREPMSGSVRPKTSRPRPVASRHDDDDDDVLVAVLNDENEEFDESKAARIRRTRKPSGEVVITAPKSPRTKTSSRDPEIDSKLDEIFSKNFNVRTSSARPASGTRKPAPRRSEEVRSSLDKTTRTGGYSRPERPSRSSEYGRERTSSRESVRTKERTARANAGSRERYASKTTDPRDQRGAKPSLSDRQIARRKNNVLMNKQDIALRYLGRYFLPISLIYLELIFHIFMKMNLKYLLIYTFFACALGMLGTIITHLFNEKVNKILTYVIVVFNSVIFMVEIMCKKILSQFFQIFSVMDTAAGNKLTDYKGAIISTFFKNIFGIILLFAPVIVLAVFGKKFMKYKKLRDKKLIVAAGTMVAAYVLAVIMMLLPYSGPFKPMELYRGDTNIEDQVEQLGVMTMIGQDMVHSIFGVHRDTSIDKDAINDINKYQFTPTPVVTEAPVGTLAPSETPTPSPTPIDTSPNVMNVDFAAMDNGNSSVQWLNTFLSERAPTNKNEYTGMFKDYNVIFITAEGFTGRVIDEKVTPTLYKLLHEGFYFTNFYNPYHYASTTGGECMNLLGMYPKDGEPQTMTLTGNEKIVWPFTLVNVLKKQGYAANGYHLNGNLYNRRKSHTQLGLNWHDSTELPMEKYSSGGNVWPQSDVRLVDVTFDDYINNDKFFTYYLTISGHMPYSNGESQMAYKNFNRVKDLPYTRETLDYISAQLELEDAVATLIDKLDKAGKLDNTLIVLAPDHIPYFNLPTIEELAGEKYGDSKDAEYLKESKYNLEVYRSNCIIWSSTMKEPVVCDKVCDSVDILPTVLNLLGAEYDSRLIGGQDILSTTPGLIVSATRCWWTDYGFYSVYTGKFTPNDKCPLKQEEIDDYVKSVNTLAQYTAKMTILAQETNYFSMLKFK